jgi:hypothetical protein
VSIEVVSATSSLAPSWPAWPTWLSWLVGIVAMGGAAGVCARRVSGSWPWAARARRVVRPAPFALELLVADRGRRRALEGELRAALSRLQLLLGPALPAHTSVVVQDTICQEGALAGCTHLGERSGGASYAIVRLALRVQEQELSADQVLAVLAEQCLALAAQRDARTTVVLPVELPAPAARGDRGAGATESRWPVADAAVPPDPLAIPLPLSPLGAYQGRDGLARTHRPG